MSIGIPEHAAEEIKTRLRHLLPILLAILILYGARLWYLQIYQGKYFKEKSEIYSIRTERVIANRGIISDRNGLVIVENRPSFNVNVVPEDCPDTAQLQQNLINLLPQYEAEITKNWGKLKKNAPFVPCTVLTDINFPDVAIIEARSDELPGIVISYDAKRFYKYGEQAAHIIGYMAKITPGEWERLKTDAGKRFQKSDVIGKSGVEKIYNDILTGYSRDIIYEADAQGRKIDILTAEEMRRPIPGIDIALTLEWRLQQFIEEKLDGVTGSCVVMDVENGEILAMVNKPSYNPNLFSLGISQDNWQALLNDEKNPMINRALQAAYPPGSIFKIITAAAALEHDIIVPQSTHVCLGRERFFGDYRSCWKGSGHGKMDLHHAIVNSCNIYFFDIATKLGINEISEMASRFGLGQKTGIIIPNEERGLIPTPEWKERVLHQPWWQGETLSVAIGQGSVLTTPLQLARLMAVIANGGALVKPRLVYKIGEKVADNDAPVPALFVEKSIMDTIRLALYGVVENPHGTARAVRLKVGIAGKTGTSQVVTKEIVAKYGKEIPEKYRDHNWFACYAPYEKPRIALCIFIEHGGREGTRLKIGMTKEILDFYFREIDSANLPQEKYLYPFKNEE